MGILPTVVKLSADGTQGRRKRKEPEYEPIPIIGIPNTEVEIEETVRTIPMEGGSIVQPEIEIPVVSIDNPVEVDNTTTVTSRLNEAYEEPTVITVDTQPATYQEEQVDVSVTPGGAVVNIVPHAEEAIGETVDDLPNIFGRRLKDPVTVK